MKSKSTPAFGIGVMVGFATMLAPLALALSQLPLPGLFQQVRLLGLVATAVALISAIQGWRGGVIKGWHLIGSAAILVSVWVAVLIEITRLKP